LSTSKQSDVLIIGAGIAGLMCATRLKEHGADIQVVDKGRHYGGRMATRQFDSAIFDHGAQFFTVREAMFQHYVDQWEAAGVIDIWFETMPGRESRHPRWYAPKGMNSLPRHIAQPLATNLSTKITHIKRTDNEWIAKSEKGDQYHAKQLIITTPSPQTLELLKTCNTPIPTDIREPLENVVYDKGLAVLLRLSSPSQLPTPGCMQLDHPSIAWIADNQIKGISDLPALTVHTTAAFATEIWDEPNEKKISLVTDELKSLLNFSIHSAQAHRWGYTMPSNPLSERSLACPDLHLTLAGDALGGPKVEGSACSGLSAADQIATTPAP
jgi:predicted NAD/FAD-dependent oxidoreductase